jgi:hypothetical protein
MGGLTSKNRRERRRFTGQVLYRKRPGVLAMGLIQTAVASAAAHYGMVRKVAVQSFASAPARMKCYSTQRNVIYEDRLLSG